MLVSKSDFSPADFTRDGLTPSVVWLPARGPATLLDFLDARFAALGREVWAARLRDGDVLDQTGQTLGVETAFLPNQPVYYFREPAFEPPIPFDYQLRFEDDYLLVVDKPHFLPCIPSGRYARETLMARLRRDFDEPGLQLLHRLDRDTAGVIVVSRRPEDRNAYSALFRSREVHKVYEAVAPALPNVTFPLIRRSRIIEAEQFFLSEEVAGEPNAESLIEVLDTRDGRALYRLTPSSGKKHQLRVHMMAIGAPIENDALYPVPHPAGEEDYSRPLQLLARSIAFIDPVTGESRTFASGLNLNW
ncbi:pseudouridine synthase [Burkholderiaceae bacterium DAT-1]|nr:pseudouridine synthase [Burkholderiaceae bacterium DAT-1]